MNPTYSLDETAIILIGYQNDYFSPTGALHQVVSARASEVLEKTLYALDRLQVTGISLISTPILFTPTYAEIVAPVGILKFIMEAGAFRTGTVGGETIPELKQFGNRILEIPGKRGLNAFSNTHLLQTLKQNGIRRVVLAGVVTSLCIESTGREAFENGFHVTILSDATAGRTELEQEFYCRDIFPMYAEVMSTQTFLDESLL